jgi:hypothetical protein
VPDGADRVVELQQVHPLAPEPAQAPVERARDGDTRVAEAGRIQADLRRHDAFRAERAQDLPQVLLGEAVAVVGGGVEERHAELQGAGDRPLPLGRGAPDHQAADVAAAESEHRDA